MSRGVVSVREWCDLLGPEVMLALGEYGYPSVQGMHSPSSCGHFHLRMMDLLELDRPGNWLVEFSYANHEDLRFKF